MFNSFFMAGFECATGLNRRREWFDLIANTQHDRFADLDYRLLRQVGLHAAREAVRWPLVDLGRGRYDFSSIVPHLEASRRHGIEVIWDLFHFGYPCELDLFSEDFPKRFADYCGAAARFIDPRTEGTFYVTPVNEPSYFAWAAGEAGLFAPYWQGRARALKIALVRAAIRGIDAIRAECPGARIVNVDPVCRVVTPDDRPDLREAVSDFNDAAVFESLDMLCGRRLPELGGSRDHLDIIGINYYRTNQWVLGHEGRPLDDDDPRRSPLRDLVRTVWERYGGDLIMSETSHMGDMRAAWLGELSEEAEAVLEMGIPLRGVCLYPILGMTDWHDQHEWKNMGLWDLVPQSPTLGRILHRPTYEALRAAQRRLEGRQRDRVARAG